MGPRHATLVFLIYLLAFSASVHAQTKRQNKNTARDLQEVDTDFAFQGEYQGTTGDQGQIGLQVVAQGSGKFIAVQFDGGLPGNGWNYSKRIRFVGDWVEGLVKLQGDQGSFLVHPEHAQWVNQQGVVAGLLTKMHRVSPTIGLRPPWNAKILFDGSSSDQLQGAKVTEQGLLQAGVTTKDSFGDFRLHVEFRLPYMPYARGQGRANSGLYLQRRYEVQVLDSFGLDGVFNECGALYRQKEPEVNMCLPPLSWQTYDISFRGSRWNDKQKLEDARITVFLNGVAVHYHRDILNKTGAGRPEGPQPLPIYLQDHGNPVAYRNYWVVEGDPFAHTRPIARRQDGYNPKRKRGSTWR